MSSSANDKPNGIVPTVTSTPMFQSIPEAELKTNQKYLIEKKTLSNGKTITRKYKGVLAELKNNKNCYKFKYLENVNKKDNEKFKETIHDMIFNGDDDETFIKMYDSPADGGMLTLEQLKTMKETSRVVLGNTYYVRYVGPDETIDLTDQDAFRGRYDGMDKDTDDEDTDDHIFSNIVKIDTSICLKGGTTVTFYYTAEDLINFDRERRAFGEIIPYGQAILNTPSERFGGNKRKTNRRKAIC